MVKTKGKIGKIYCPVNGWDCRYFKSDGTCSMYPESDPVDECDDFAIFWQKGDSYIVYPRED